MLVCRHVKGLAALGVVLGNDRARDPEQDPAAPFDLGKAREYQAIVLREHEEQCPTRGPLAPIVDPEAD